MVDPSALYGRWFPPKSSKFVLHPSTTCIRRCFHEEVADYLDRTRLRPCIRHCCQCHEAREAQCSGGEGVQRQDAGHGSNRGWQEDQVSGIEEDGTGNTREEVTILS